MLYNKLLNYKVITDLDDVRDYIENGLYKAAITRLNLIKKDMVKAQEHIANSTKLRGRVRWVKRKTN